MNHAARERYRDTASTVAVTVLGAVPPRWSTPDPTAWTSVRKAPTEPGVAVILDCRGCNRGTRDAIPLVEDAMHRHPHMHAGCALPRGLARSESVGELAYRVRHGELPSPARDSPSGGEGVGLPWRGTTQGRVCDSELQVGRYAG